MRVDELDDLCVVLADLCGGDPGEMRGRPLPDILHLAADMLKAKNADFNCCRVCKRALSTVVSKDGICYYCLPDLFR